MARMTKMMEMRGEADRIVAKMMRRETGRQGKTSDQVKQARQSRQAVAKMNELLILGIR